MSKIYLFRHAQASIGKANYDILSTKGEKQAAELGKYLCEEKLIFDRVYVGNLQRQKHTQEIVAKQYKRSGLTIPKASSEEGPNVADDFHAGPRQENASHAVKEYRRILTHFT